MEFRVKFRVVHIFFFFLFFSPRLLTQFGDFSNEMDCAAIFDREVRVSNTFGMYS